MTTAKKQSSAAAGKAPPRAGAAKGVAKTARKVPAVATREAPKFAAVKISAGRYQVLAPALEPRHVTTEVLDAAVLNLAR